MTIKEILIKYSKELEEIRIKTDEVFNLVLKNNQAFFILHYHF